MELDPRLDRYQRFTTMHNDFNIKESAQTNNIDLYSHNIMIYSFIEYSEKKRIYN